MNISLNGSADFPDPMNVKLTDADMASLLNNITVSLSDETIAKLTLSFKEMLMSIMPDPTPPDPTPPDPTPPDPTPPDPTPPDPTPPAPVSRLQEPAYGPPSADSRVIYVSSSTGNDTNDGSIAAPKKTIANAITLLRDGYPDRLLLKKGDVWYETLGTWKKGGRSISEPLVIASYGEGDRPVLKTGSATGFVCQNSSGTPLFVNHVIISGLKFHANNRDPMDQSFTNSSGTPVGVRWLRGTTGFKVDDCVISNYHTGIVVQNYDGNGVTNVEIIGCVIDHCYSDRSLNQGHSNGMYVSGVNGLTIEDCVFNHNGYHELIPGSSADIYQHNLYIQYDNRNVTVRRNVFMNASSHGVQLRPGGILEDNFFYRNPIAITVGYKDNLSNPGLVEAVVSKNVMLEGTDITSALPRGWGLHIEANDVKLVNVIDNLASTVTVSGPNIMSILKVQNATYSGNKAYKWPTKWGGVNTEFDVTGPFVDPDRTLNNYNNLTLDQNTTKLLSQSRDAFDTNYAALNLNKYINDGFKPL